MRFKEKILGVLKGLQLSRRFFMAGGIVIALTALSFAIPILFPLSQGLLAILMLTAIADSMLLFSKANGFKARRHTLKLLSLGDANTMSITIENKLPFRVNTVVFDELPIQLQTRDFQMSHTFEAGKSHTFSFEINPLARGEYHFGRTNILATSRIGLVARRFKIKTNTSIPTFPSIVQMKKYELLAFAKTSTLEGIKKVRRLGHSYEFEHIKPYVQGDDIRSINWKATSRRNTLMVNQYEDERSQQMYAIIDKSRVMHMPFNGLTLLDYAINSSLVIANIALKKHDRAGLITFSNSVGSTIKADKGANQLKKILHALYNEKSFVREANYDLLYRASKNIISSRSLIFLFTNFESTFAMERALPVLRKINHHHLLVVIIFENSELIDYSQKKVESLSDIYTQTTAEKLVLEKKQITHRMRKEGIQTILSKPEDLSINTVNKYLELKSKGLT
jgi:uncharacterized protein (DUF58 family)